jgi:hypothetical protein
LSQWLALTYAEELDGRLELPSRSDANPEIIEIQGIFVLKERRFEQVEVGHRHDLPTVGIGKRFSRTTL